MVEIMHNYHQYVPENPDGTPFTIPLLCDGLSCERGHDAHVSVFNAMTPWSHLEGLALPVQEWHRRQLQMEDLWKAAYSSTTPREVGTLYQLRNVLRMTNVKSDVTKCMNHATEFCDIILDGYVVGMALTVMKTNVIDQPPQDFPEDEEQLIFQRKCHRSSYGTCISPPWHSLCKLWSPQTAVVVIYYQKQPWLCIQMRVSVWEEPGTMLAVSA